MTYCFANLVISMKFICWQYCFLVICSFNISILAASFLLSRYTRTPPALVVRGSRDRKYTIMIGYEARQFLFEIIQVNYAFEDKILSVGYREHLKHFCRRRLKPRIEKRRPRSLSKNV